jgi:hypothetical protein
MKTIFIFISLILLHNVIEASESFLQKKLDTATIVMVDIVEEIEKNYQTCSSENIDEIKTQVHELMQAALDKKDTSMRLYSFITVSYTFNLKKNNDSYLYFVLLCAEINPSILQNKSDEQIKILELLLSDKAIELYEDRKIQTAQILPDCYVSCVQIGVEKIQ